MRQTARTASLLVLSTLAGLGVVAPAAHAAAKPSTITPSKLKAGKTTHVKVINHVCEADEMQVYGKQVDAQPGFLSMYGKGVYKGNLPILAGAKSGKLTLRCGGVTVGTVKITIAKTTKPTTGGGGSGKCVEGLSTINGDQARTFCGTASASATIGGTTYKVKGQGECDITNGTTFSVNIGTIIIGDSKQTPPDYLGFDVDPDGNAIGGVNVNGVKHGSTSFMVTLNAAKTAGTFSFPDAATGETVSGSFDCGGPPGTNTI